MFSHLVPNPRMKSLETKLGKIGGRKGVFGRGRKRGLLFPILRKQGNGLIGGIDDGQSARARFNTSEGQILSGTLKRLRRAGS